MHEIAVDRREIGIFRHQGHEVGAHAHQGLRTAGGAVEPAQQLLPARLGMNVQVGGDAVGGLGEPGRDRLLEASLIRTESVQQGLEKGEASLHVEARIAAQDFGGYGDAGSFAAAGEQGFAQRDHFGGLGPRHLRGIATAQEIAAAFGDGRNQVGKQRIVHAHRQPRVSLGSIGCQYNAFRRLAVAPFDEGSGS